MASLLYLMGFITEPPPDGKLEELSRETELHVTLMPAFSVSDRGLLRLRMTIEAVADWFPPVPCEPMGTAVFGVPPLDAPVVLYDPHAHQPYSLFNLHASLSKALKQCGGQYLDPYVHDKYTPHSSYGDPTAAPLLTSLTLVEHRGGFGEDMVALHTYVLGGESV